MKGSIVRRGRKSWRIIFDVGRDGAGKRIRHYHTVRGTRQDAEQKLVDLLSARAKGDYAAPSRITVGEYVGARVNHWEAAGEISPKTVERYRQLVEAQIVPWLGSVQVQKAYAARYREVAYATASGGPQGRQGGRQRPHNRPRAPRAWQGPQGCAASRFG
jgi:integrase